MQRANPSFRPSFLLVPCVLLACAAPVLAQQAGSPPPRVRDLGWVSAVAGASFGTQNLGAAALGGEYGEDLHPQVQAYATISYFDNLMQQDVRDDLSRLSVALTNVTGTPWELRGRDRAVTFIAGGRYLLRPQANVRPYLGAGAGVINLKRRIVDPRVGDVTVAVLNDFGVGALALTTRSDTGPLVEAAAGIGFFEGPTYVDVGYRYKRAMGVGQTLNFSQLVAGIGYRF